MENRALVVGGTFNLTHGYPSKFINKVLKCLEAKNIDVVHSFNGGDYSELPSIAEFANEVDMVFWLPEVPNWLKKMPNGKDVNPNVILITSKRNESGKYSAADLMEYARENNSRFVIELKLIRKDTFHMMVIDRLGIVYYKGEDVNECIDTIIYFLDKFNNIEGEEKGEC